MGLSSTELEVFGEVADALLPPLPGDGRFWTSSASDLGVTERLAGQVERLPDDEAREALRKLLRALDTRVGGLVLYGRARRFRDLTPPGAEAALGRMAASRLSQRRQAFQALKRLIAIVAVTAPDANSPSPIWADIGYPGADSTPPADPGPISTTPVTEPSEWDADVVVVGSGAGGGTAAGVLAAAGLDVVVIEKGPHVTETEFTHLEHDAYERLYLDGNLAPTADLGIGMQAGSCLGGGTVVNYTVSLATPDHVRQEWDRSRAHHSGAGGARLGPRRSPGSREKWANHLDGYRARRAGGLVRPFRAARPRHCRNHLAGGIAPVVRIDRDRRILGVMAGEARLLANQALVPRVAHVAERCLWPGVGDICGSGPHNGSGCLHRRRTTHPLGRAGSDRPGRAGSSLTAGSGSSLCDYGQCPSAAPKPPSKGSSAPLPVLIGIGAASGPPLLLWAGVSSVA